VTVSWTDTAISHLIAIYDYIARDSPFYAQRMIDRITRKSQQIGQFPRSGRVVPEYERDDLREVIEKPYRIIYRIRPDQIDVIAVVHGAQILPAEL
jgi:toxin ParE1/3/4